MGLGLAAGSLARRPWAQAANFDWMQQKGKSIVVTAPLSPYYTVLQKMIPDFTKLTGIQVEYQVVPEQQLRQKLPIEMNAKSPGIDVFASSMHVEKILFSAAGWYEPLNKYLDNPNLTPPDYNWKDFGPAGTYWGLKGDGTIVAIPMGVGLGAYMYRKDLYTEKGLPWEAVKETIENAGDLSGKILIDPINPLSSDLKDLIVGRSTSAAEEISKLAQGAKVVKAFNAIGAKTLGNLKFGQYNADTFICGDNSGAKSIVRKLAMEMGFDVVDVGSLSNARLLENLALLWIELAFRQEMGPNIAFKLLTRTSGM